MNITVNIQPSNNVNKHIIKKRSLHRMIKNHPEMASFLCYIILP